MAINEDEEEGTNNGINRDLDQRLYFCIHGWTYCNISLAQTMGGRMEWPGMRNGFFGQIREEFSPTHVNEESD